MKSELPKRKSPRAWWLEYNEGLFFITVCTQGRKHFFGEIEDEMMVYSPVGTFLVKELENAVSHHANVKVLQYVVMPNHFHAIIDISPSMPTADAARNVPTADAARSVPTREERMSGCGKGSARTVLSTYIGSLKSAVTRYARSINPDFAWQPRYHDHAIRGVDDGNNISLYIEHNVANWALDCFYDMEG